MSIVSVVRAETWVQYLKVFLRNLPSVTESRKYLPHTWADCQVEWFSFRSLCLMLCCTPHVLLPHFVSLVTAHNNLLKQAEKYALPSIIRCNTLLFLWAYEVNPVTLLITWGQMMSMVGKELIQVHGGKLWQWLVIKELIQVHIAHMGANDGNGW